MKPTVLYVTTVYPNNSMEKFPLKDQMGQKREFPKYSHKMIDNKKDVVRMFQILMRSPKQHNGPISCPSDSGVRYILNFKNKNQTKQITVNPTGCEGVTSSSSVQKTLSGYKQADDFWYLLAKNLKVETYDLRWKYQILVFKNSSAEEILLDLDNYLVRGKKGYLDMLKTIKPSSDLIVDGTLPTSNIVRIITQNIVEHDLSWFDIKLTTAIVKEGVANVGNSYCVKGHDCGIAIKYDVCKFGGEYESNNL